jgi:hypothetical protein
MHFKKTSPFVLSMLFASCNNIELDRQKLGKGNTKDIAENDVDPWVYEKVSPNVEYESLGRTSEAPAVDKYWETKPFVPPELKGLDMKKKEAAALA